MSNVKIFIALFVCVQILFMSLDAMDLWITEKAKGQQRILVESRPVILLVVFSCSAYFVVQLLLSALMPGLPSLIRFAARFTGNVTSGAATVPLGGLLFVLVTAYLATTLFDYLVHRFLLHGWLWRLHENHHLPTVVSNFMPGIAARPFVAIPNVIINLGSGLSVLWIFRVVDRPHFVAAMPAVIPVLIAWFAFVLCASHSSFLRRFDFVDRLFRALVIISPREHLLHHAAHHRGNYGNFTALWDRLFGTYLSPSMISDPVLGLSYDQDFLGALSAGRLKLSDSMRRRYQVDRVCHIDQEES